jgi:hypothetical protein
MAEEPSDFRASITELQAVLLGTESIDGFLQEVASLASLAARELGEGLSCGITLQPNLGLSRGIRPGCSLCEKDMKKVPSAGRIGLI